MAEWLKCPTRILGSRVRVPVHSENKKRGEGTFLRSQSTEAALGRVTPEGWSFQRSVTPGLQALGGVTPDKSLQQGWESGVVAWHLEG